MIFSNLLFIFIFLPIFLCIYYIVPMKFKNFILLVFSLIFYGFGEPIYILLLLFVSIMNYIFGIFIDKSKKKTKKKLLLIGAVILNLLILMYFKYTNFIIDNMNLIGLNISPRNIKLPLGISFFIFQTLSYVIDLYYGRIKREKNFINFMTYVSMFPQLIAGPIVRYEDISNQMQEREISFKKFSNGVFIFLTGLFKKVLIANNVGYLYSLISKDIASASLMTAWLGAIAFTIQLYFDFSG